MSPHDTPPPEGQLVEGEGGEQVSLKEPLSDEENEDEEGNFPVTDEEMAEIRAELKSQFPNDHSYLSDAYILSVSSKPYSKDPTRRRPLEYSTEKLSNVLEWRANAGVTEILDLVALANGPEDSAEAVENPERLTRAKAMVTALNCGSMYFHGFTKDHRPVCWFRLKRRYWYPDVDAELDALIAILDAGIRYGMPDDVTDLVVITDTTSPPPPHPTFMYKLLKVLVGGYPDRMNYQLVGPVGHVVKTVMDYLIPLMPSRLASKVALFEEEGIKPKLKEILLNGEDDIPTFLGGPADHDQCYPDPSLCENQGEGSLKFDFYGMIERLKKAKDELK